jgi:predicted dehydrogenase/threonine dehydrogenase-like Zn-dependent dehydrogenase
MLQVAVSKGQICVVEVPEPVLRSGGILVRTSHSLISVGTESAIIGGGGQRESLIMKAIRNPALVRRVLERVATHGLRSTVELVKDRVSSDQPVGYSCSGVVLEAAPDITGFSPGDRVACCGVGYANHAAVNFVPRNLAAKIPEGVSFEEGAFGTLGAIALHGVRRCAPQIGDRVVVLGLGLLGQLTAQLLRAAGAVVIGVDVREERVRRALVLGLSDGFNSTERDFVAGVMERTEGRGADAVIVTAAAGDPGLLNRSFDACRRKGRVVLVGDVPIRIQRDKIYRKELDFLISTSYGPGRYDPEYEEQGRDYPFAYVRWTEGRNLSEVLRLISAGSLSVRPLIDAIHPIEKAGEAYASLASEARPTGVLLDYHMEAPPDAARPAHPVRKGAAGAATGGTLRVGVIGYGSYFRAVLLPLLKAHRGFSLSAVCARTGLTVQGAVEKDGFAGGTTDYQEVLSDPNIDVVYITTRHDQHFSIARSAIEAGKAVFVEKPMTMTTADGEDLVRLVGEKKGILTVGFNRRFSPHAQRLKALLAPIKAPKMMNYRVNAGALPPGHWLFDPAQGGGRLLGEGVHFFDFLAFLAAAEPRRLSGAPLGGHPRDEAAVTVEFADGSVGMIVYTGDGCAGSGKERIEVFAGGASFVLDDFRSLEVFGMSQKGLKTSKVEKGQKEQLENFYKAIRGEEDLGVTAEDGLRATRCAQQALAFFAKHS